MQSLKAQRVLVVGGSSGIGLAVAKAAAEAGADVTIASRSAEKLNAAAAEIGEATKTRALDTRDAAGVAAFFEAEAPWDHVVVSAAQAPTGQVRKLSLEDARAAMDSKFWGAYHVARAAKINESGSLTLVSGYRSDRPSPNSVLQGAINAAVDGLARSLALELAPVRVNSVSPGTIVTPMWDRMPEDDRQLMFEKTAAKLPVKRVGRPEDAANAAMYLMTTPYATGSTVRIDGGGTIAPA